MSKKGKKIDGLKALSIGATIVGLAASLFSSFVDEKKTDAKISEKVEKAVSNAMNKKED